MTATLEQLREIREEAQQHLRAKQFSETMLCIIDIYTKHYPNYDVGLEAIQAAYLFGLAEGSKGRLLEEFWKEASR